jgi:DNA-binding CsgD family transcriptional regulator
MPKAYPLAVSVVIGREAELAEVEAFFGHGHLTALALVGEAGIGKTTVWTWIVESARSGGSIMLAARPAESEAGLTFAGLADLLATVPEPAFESIPALQRSALDVALLRALPRRPPERRLVGTALLSLLGALSREADVVLAVDDLHWLDAPSAAVLEFALRRVAGPVRAVLSVRSEEPEPSLLASLSRERRVQRLELGPLSVASLHRVLARELGRTFPRPKLVRISTASRGNPLYAIEIARAIDHRDDHAPLPVPGKLGVLVAARVRSLPAATREALLRAAALARPDLRLVDGDALAAAEEAGLVRIEPDRRVEFVHPLYSSAVYATASLSRRRDTHRVLAGLVSDPEERARHLALACDMPDEEVAQAVDGAARQARMRGAPDRAAELTELALRLSPSGPGELERRIALAEHLYVAGDFARGAELLEDARASFPAGELRTRALLLLSELVYRLAGAAGAAPIAQQALESAQEPILRVRCHLRLASWATTSNVQATAANVDAALALLDRSPETEPGLRSSVLVNRVKADLFLGRGLDMATVQCALDLEKADPPRDVDERLVFTLGLWLRYVDDLDGARTQFEEAQRTAREEGDDASLVNILFNRMTVELWAGEWARAQGFARELGEIAEQLSLTNVSRAWIAYLDAHRGRLEAVRQAVEQANRQDALFDMLYLRALGVAELGADLYQSADAHLADALRRVETMGIEEPAIWRIEGDAIEAALGAGELERGRWLLARFEERAGRSRIPWNLAVSARCRGLVHAAEGELELASAALELALVEHRRCPMPFERARTLLVRGQVLRRRKQRRSARESLEQAEEIFVRLGADAWTRRAGEQLQRVSVRRAPDELSPTELQIARLAAEGLTNRLIAERAFVSVKTVETNLKRAYRKLGISARAQLARALDEGRASNLS